MTLDDSPQLNATNHIGALYRLEMDESSNQLMGVVLPEPIGDKEVLDAARRSVTISDLAERIQKENYNLLYFPVNSQDHFLKKIQKYKAGRYALAERRDAKIKITVSSDKAIARVQTSKAWGGSYLSNESIDNEIKQCRLDVRTIDKSKLATLINSKKELDLILAKSVPVVHGTDAQLVPRVDGKVLIQHDVDSKKPIDQRELFNFIVVEIGDVLMEKIPATEGCDGLNVVGGRIKAKVGKNIQFKKPFVGVEISPDNDNYLVATIKGHPLISSDVIKVDPVMVLDAVNIHSGNVEYDGSLMVKKDIESGFSVTVSGDVFVKGSINRAVIQAGGNVTAVGGIQADGSDEDHIHHLNIQGDIVAKFLAHSKIQCQGSVYVTEYIMQCNVKAQGSINAGQERGRGKIIGGECLSNTAINTKVLGSEAYITTKVILDLGSEDQKKASALRRVLDRRNREERQLSEILDKIRLSESPTKTGQTTLNKAKKIEQTIALLRQKIDEIECQLDALDQSGVTPYISVNSRLYPNVTVVINDQSWTCEIERGTTMITQGNEMIDIN